MALVHFRNQVRTDLQPGGSTFLGVGVGVFVEEQKMGRVEEWKVEGGVRRVEAPV